jgi:hypothetical protein
MNALTLQAAIDKNAHIAFSEHVHTDTVEYFRGLRQSTIKLVGNPLPEEKASIEQLFPVPVMWEAPKHATIAPHGKLAIIRGAMRTVLDDMCHLTKNLKTLYIGAAYREIASNVRTQNAFFSLHDSEAKDEVRTFVPMLDKVNRIMQLAKQEASDLDDVEVDISIGKEGLVDLYAEVTGMPRERIGYRVEKRKTGFQCSRLIYEDSHYNKTWQDFEEDFENTGALIAYTIGLHPDQLLTDVCPESDLLRIQRKGEYMRMTDRRGYANGYIHKEKAWATLLSSPGYAGKNFNLVSEIVCRVGPFMINTISRTQKGGTIVRDITVFKEPYMKVVDLSTAFKVPENLAEAWLRTKTNMDRFFLVKRDEWDSCYDYVASLDPKAVTHPAVTAMIRKRSGGAALIDKIFTKKWELESKHYQLLAAVVMLKVAADRQMCDEAMATLFEEGWFASLWRSVLGKFKLPKWLTKLCCENEDIRRRLAVEHDPIVEQDLDLPICEKVGHQMTYQLFAAKENKTEIEITKKDKCKFCKMLPWLSKHDKSDEQEMVCGRDFVEHQFSMTDSEVEAFRNKMLPEDTDEEGLRRVKLAAREKLPRHGFSYTAKVVVLEGPFGSGKSFQTKKTMTVADSLTIPFKKLLDDYDLDARGDKIHVKTPHRAIIDAKSTHRLWTDEAGSLPYEFLACIAYLSQPEEVIIVGDFKQSKTLASEGTCIDRRIDVSGAHYLVKNFRNNHAVIEWANAKYGYHMERSTKTKDGSLYEFLPEGVETFPEGVPVISPDRAMVDIEESENTVRAYQGQTVEDLGIIITPASMRTWSVPCIKLVGLTRAKGVTYIRLVDGVSREAFEAVVNKVEYARRADKKVVVTQAANVARMVLALRRIVGEKRLELYVKAFSEEIQDALDAEDECALKHRDFLERPGTFRQFTQPDAEEIEAHHGCEEKGSCRTMWEREDEQDDVEEYDMMYLDVTVAEAEADYASLVDVIQNKTSQEVFNDTQDNWEFFLTSDYVIQIEGPRCTVHRSESQQALAQEVLEVYAALPDRDELECQIMEQASKIDGAVRSRDWWLSPGDQIERRAEVDNEIALGRPLCEHALDFLRLYPVTKASDFCIGDDDEEKEEEEDSIWGVSSDVDEDEGCSVLDL